MALPAPQRAALRGELRARLPVAADGSISLVARAWAAWAGVQPLPPVEAHQRAGQQHEPEPPR
jgi:hypothetical protein